MDLLTNIHGSYRIPSGAILTVEASTPGSSSTVSLRSAEGAVAFVSQSTSGAAPLRVGPFAVPVVLGLHANGTVGVEVSYSSGTGSANVQVGALVLDPLAAPNATAVQAAIDTAVAGATAGSTNPVTTTVTNAIQLDKVQGREMGSSTVSVNTILSVAAGAVTNGNCNWTAIGDGIHTLDFSVFYNPNGFVFNNAAGAINEMSFVKRVTAQPYILGLNGPVVDLTLPTLSIIAVALSTPYRVDLTWSEAMDADISPASAFTVSGHTVTAHTRVDATHTYLTVNNFVAGETARTLAYTVPGSSKMRDVAQNLLDPFSGVAITNNAGALPTITGIAVADSTPGVIEVTLSQPYGGSLPAFSAFAVSAGHTLNGINPGSTSSKINLGTSAPFVNGEAARTLSYTVPGSNPITSSTTAQPLATVSGVAIVNNVAAVSALIMEDDFAPGSTAIPGRVPDLNNTEGNAWYRSTGGGVDIGSDTHVATSSPNVWGYPVTSRKNYTLDTTVNFVGSASPVVHLRKASGGTTYYRLTLTSTTLAGAQVTGGVAGANDFSVAISPGETYHLQCVMGSDDSLVVKINGTAVTGATATLTGTAFGFGYSCASGTWYMEHVKAS